MKKVLSWVWFVSVWVAQILIVLYVFEHLVGRTEHIIVAILGLMYVATRLLAIVNMSFTFALHATSQAQLVRIRRLFNDDPDSMQEVATELEKMQSVIYGPRVTTTYVFLGLIFIICLLHLFSHL